MRKWLLFVVCMGCCFWASAQQSFFIYFQSDQDQPFYVRIGDQVLSSSTSGYVLLPNLSDSTYTLRVGLPGAVVREEKFIVPINGDDHGFLVQATEASLSLNEMHAGQSLQPIPDESRANITYEARTDAFTLLLSKASEDPSLLYVAVVNNNPKATTVAVKETTPVDPKTTGPARDTVTAGTLTEAKLVEIAKDSSVTAVVPIEIKDSAVVSVGIKDSAVVSIGAKDSVLVSVGVKDSAVVVSTPVQTIDSSVVMKPVQDTVAVALQDTLAIQPRQEVAKQDSVQLTRDTAVTLTDSVQVASLRPEVVTDTVAQNVVRDSISNTVGEPWVPSVVKRYSESSTSEGFGLVYIDGEGNDTIRLLIPNPRIVFRQPDTAEKDSSLFLEIKRDTVAQPAQAGAGTPSEKVKTTCRSLARESDFFKLRRNMAARTDDEDMISEARKAFKNKCYTTEQVRYLSALFLTSASKYLFFEAAFGHVSDPALFTTLVSELRDEHYINRFKLLSGE